MITYQEYWGEVDSLVASIVEAAIEGAAGDEDTARDLANDRAREDIDGHQWVIYTAYNPYVLIHSANEDAAFETLGTLDGESYGAVMAVMAFFALRADVEDKLHDALGEAMEAWERHAAEVGA